MPSNFVPQASLIFLTKIRVTANSKSFAVLATLEMRLIKAYFSSRQVCILPSYLGAK